MNAGIVVLLGAAALLAMGGGAFAALRPRDEGEDFYDEWGADAGSWFDQSWYGGGGGSMALSGRVSSLPLWEQEKIIAVASDFGIDPVFLAALRIAENGGPGREYGVLSVPAPTYDDQITIAARSIKNHEGRYASAGGIVYGPDGRYTEGFIRDFSARWAPLGVTNDPTGLNSYHAGNLLAYYGGSSLTVA